MVEDRDVLRHAIDRTAPVVVDAHVAQARIDAVQLADIATPVLRAAVEAAQKGITNTQLQPRIELMQKILSLLK